jgi:hypothetical protein
VSSTVDFVVSADAAVGIVAMTAMATLTTVHRLRLAVATAGFASMFMRLIAGQCGLSRVWRRVQRGWRPVGRLPFWC